MTALPLLVPDASVLLKWVLESDKEEDRDHALGIRAAWLAGRCEIALPSLWFFEVGNILGIKQPKLAPSLMRLLVDYGFDEEPANLIFARAFELMKTFKVTFYDAAYHAVAIQRLGTMITADATYRRKAAKAGHLSGLADWSSEIRLPGASPTG